MQLDLFSIKVMLLLMEGRKLHIKQENHLKTVLFLWKISSDCLTECMFGRMRVFVKRSEVALSCWKVLYECGAFATHHLDLNLGPNLMVCTGAFKKQMSSFKICKT